MHAHARPPPWLVRWTARRAGSRGSRVWKVDVVPGTAAAATSPRCPLRRCLPSHYPLTATPCAVALRRPPQPRPPQPHAPQPRPPQPRPLGHQRIRGRRRPWRWEAGCSHRGSRGRGSRWVASGASLTRHSPQPTRLGSQAWGCRGQSPTCEARSARSQAWCHRSSCGVVRRLYHTPEARAVGRSHAP